MIKYGCLKNKHLSFVDDGTFYFPDERKKIKFYEYIDFMNRYIVCTKLKYVIYAKLENGKFANSIVMIDKPIVFTSLYAFKMFVIKGSPNTFFYVERR